MTDKTIGNPSNRVFLFGVIVKCEEEPSTHNTVNIWRPKSSFSLGDVNAIELIETIDEIKAKNITCNFCC